MTGMKGMRKGHDEVVASYWAKRLAARREAWLRTLKVGDRVMAGAGLHAELRDTYSGPDDPNTVVRYLQYAEDHPGNWWGYDHGRVSWSTIKPWKEEE